MGGPGGGCYLPWVWLQIHHDGPPMETGSHCAVHAEREREGGRDRDRDRETETETEIETERQRDRETERER